MTVLVRVSCSLMILEEERKSDGRGMEESYGGGWSRRKMRRDGREQRRREVGKKTCVGATKESQ